MRIKNLFAWQRSAQGLIGDQKPLYAKLFISKFVAISFSHWYVFSSKRCFLPQPEFLDKMQEPFGEVLLWLLDPPYLEPR